MAGLKPAARAFVKSVFDVLAERSQAYEAGSDGFPRWTSRGNNNFVLAPRELSAEEVCLDRELMLSSPEVPQRARFRSAVATDARLSPLIGKLVGTALQSQRVDEETLERTLLWTVWRANASLQYTDGGFDQGYRSWLAQTLAREERLTILAPLAGFTFTGQIELPDGLVIGQLRDDEIESLIG